MDIEPKPNQPQSKRTDKFSPNKVKTRQNEPYGTKQKKL